MFLHALSVLSVVALSARPSIGRGQHEGNPNGEQHFEERSRAPNRGTPADRLDGIRRRPVVHRRIARRPLGPGGGETSAR